MSAARFTLARLAVVWCAQPAFQSWLGVDSIKAARGVILERCNITSRAELDRDPAAARAFHEHIRRPFAEHIANQLEAA